MVPRANGAVPSLPGHNGRALPCPGFYGFSWGEFDEAIEAYRRVFEESHKVSQELVQAEAEVAALEQWEVSGIADAMLAGDGSGPDDKPLRKALARREKLTKKSQAASLALNRAAARIYQLVEKQRDKWTEEVAEREEEAYSQISGIISSLKAAQAELYALDALSAWLANPRRSFAPRSGPMEITTFGSGTVRPEEVLDAILEDARHKVNGGLGEPHPATSTPAPEIPVTRRAGFREKLRGG